MNYEVISSYDDGTRKVVEIVARVEGTEGPTEEYHTLQWGFDERYKDSPSGKRVPKTGPDYKAEINDYLDEYYSPKATGPY